nr:putative NHN endonuclease [uncultured Mediterranean phage uvMED]
MANFKPLPPLEELQKILSYDPGTGVFTWIVSVSPKALAGSAAGSFDPRGYGKLVYRYKPYLLHRLAWLFGTGEDPRSFTVDHINRDKRDNRLQNLRLATSRQQQGNKGLQSNNISGIKGVHWDKARGKWVAYIALNRKVKNLGRYPTKEEAAEAYQKAAANHFGEFMAS